MRVRVCCRSTLRILHQAIGHKAPPPLPLPLAPRDSLTSHPQLPPDAPPPKLGSSQVRAVRSNRSEPQRTVRGSRGLLGKHSSAVP